MSSFEMVSFIDLIQNQPTHMVNVNVITFHVLYKPYFVLIFSSIITQLYHSIFFYEYKHELNNYKPTIRFPAKTGQLTTTTNYHTSIYSVMSLSPSNPLNSIRLPPLDISA